LLQIVSIPRLQYLKRYCFLDWHTLGAADIKSRALSIDFLDSEEFRIELPFSINAGNVPSLNTPPP
jgi:hypothetical protein